VQLRCGCTRNSLVSARGPRPCSKLTASTPGPGVRQGLHRTYH
jgi:hypothetical protein